jgi:cyclophilin family peptidyl-prolyl cis-trans isomerase
LSQLRLRRSLLVIGLLIIALLAVAACTTPPAGTTPTEAPATEAPTTAPAEQPTAAIVELTPPTVSTPISMGVQPVLTTDGSRPLADLEPAQRHGVYGQAPDMVIDPDTIYLATISTAKGDVVLELFGQEAPIAVNNFVVLSQLGFYDAMPVYPVGPPQAVLTGDPTGDGQGNPGYDLPAEIGIPNLAGTMGYLRFPDQINPEQLSNGSQIYITLEAVPDIDGVYAAFGQVIEGLDVLSQLVMGDVIDTIAISEAETRVAPTPAPPTPTPTPFAPSSAADRPLAALDPAERIDAFNMPPAMELEEGVDYQARITTDVGEIVVDLFEEQTPLTVNNFVVLANLGFFDNTLFHRVIDGFMAQAGDPSGSGRGGPGYVFADEIVPELVFDKAGLLAMANAGPGTNGSQFFITFDAADWLNGQHTIFGQVIEGEDLLPQILRRDPVDPAAPATMIESIVIETK